MERKISATPIWLLVEPTFYPHSEGYLRAILEDEEIRKGFEIVYVYGETGTKSDEVIDKLHSEFEEMLTPVKVKLKDDQRLGNTVSVLVRTWKVMKVANTLTRQHGAKLISILRADDFIRLLAVPGVSIFFPDVRGRVTGVFFNSRCFRENSFLLNILASAVCRVLQSGYFKKMLFLDHGVCEKVTGKLDSDNSNVVGKAIDPWTSEPETKEQEPVIDDHKTTLLTFGAHSGRKGTVSLLRMFRDYAEELADYRLVIAGPIRDDIRDEFEALIAEIDNSDRKIECVSKYISDNDSWSYFRRSQIVLCPYVNFHGSSNVIIRATAVGVPVVAPSFGFLGEVVEQNKIGATYQSQDPAAILEAIFIVEKMLVSDSKLVRSNCIKYANQHSAACYAHSLISPFREESSEADSACYLCSS